MGRSGTAAATRAVLKAVAGEPARAAALAAGASGLSSAQGKVATPAVAAAAADVDGQAAAAGAPSPSTRLGVSSSRGAAAAETTDQWYLACRNQAAIAVPRAAWLQALLPLQLSASGATTRTTAAARFLHRSGGASHSAAWVSTGQYRSLTAAAGLPGHPAAPNPQTLAPEAPSLEGPGELASDALARIQQAQGAEEVHDLLLQLAGPLPTAPAVRAAHSTATSPSSAVDAAVPDGSGDATTAAPSASLAGSGSECKPAATPQPQPLPLPPPPAASLELLLKLSVLPPPNPDATSPHRLAALRHASAVLLRHLHPHLPAMDTPALVGLLAACSRLTWALGRPPVPLPGTDQQQQQRQQQPPAAVGRGRADGDAHVAPVPAAGRQQRVHPAQPVIAALLQGGTAFGVRLKAAGR